MNNETTAWKDITSYSRSNKERIPSMWEYSNGVVRVSVVGRHRDYPDTWLMNCRELGISNFEISPKPGVSPETAQALALTTVKLKATQIAESLKE